MICGRLRQFEATGQARVVEKEVSSLAGQYRLPSGIGSQVQSLKRTGSATRFGSSTRDNASKVYISAEHEKGSVGLASPGPCTAVQVLICFTCQSAIAGAAQWPIAMGETDADRVDTAAAALRLDLARLAVTK